MIEKVNPCHPDKVADRIAGAIVDLAYRDHKNPKVAVEVLIGHGTCYIIIESDVDFNPVEVENSVRRITCSDSIKVNLVVVPQDPYLNNNQKYSIRCGDNGIFKGTPITDEQRMLSKISRDIYSRYPFDGKYILDGDKLIICQSNAEKDDLLKLFPDAIINPLGYWIGGTNVDSGATNRKLGSDMADGVTGGGLHGKDLSKADVSVNIYAFLKSQETGKVVQLCCAIGDEVVDGKSYAEIVEIARNFINSLGGFEKFAEWGLY